MTRLAWLFAIPLLAAADSPGGDGDMPDAGLRAAIGAALAVVESHSAAVWPASPDAPRQILLVERDRELLFCPEAEVAAALAEHGFLPLGYDPISTCDVAVRPAVFAPNLLSTFPAVGGVSTIVVGTPAATGWSIDDWAATLLHEHVHQMQASAPAYASGTVALDLAGGDETGRWMLSYPFPYVEAAPGFRRLADAAVAALAADASALSAAARDYVAEREAFLASLAPNDARYFEFQLWQEGVARWSEMALVEAAGDRWPFSPGWLERQRARNAVELEGADLADRGRPAFYALGAAEAEILERLDAGWRSRYLSEPLAMGPYFP